MMLCPSTCCVTGISGEPGTTQARYSSNVPVKMPWSMIACGQYDSAMSWALRRSSPRASRARQPRIFSRSSSSANS